MSFKKAVWAVVVAVLIAATVSAQTATGTIAGRVLDASGLPLPGTTVNINSKAPVDSRSYRVDFSLFETLAPNHRPQVTLPQSIAGLISGLRGMGFNDPEFRDSEYMRLRVLRGHIQSRRLSDELTWLPT